MGGNLTFNNNIVVGQLLGMLYLCIVFGTLFNRNT